MRLSSLINIGLDTDFTPVLLDTIIEMLYTSAVML